jgi:hypothetical protein
LPRRRRWTSSRDHRLKWCPRPQFYYSTTLEGPRSRSPPARQPLVQRILQTIVDRPNRRSPPRAHTERGTKLPHSPRSRRPRLRRDAPNRIGLRFTTLKPSPSPISAFTHRQACFYSHLLPVPVFLPSAKPHLAPFDQALRGRPLPRLHPTATSCSRIFPPAQRRLSSFLRASSRSFAIMT